jgi:tetratricopeptide (TPR) repeat protein
VLGLALAHHLTALLVVPSVGLALLFGRRERPSRLSALAALGLLAAGLTLYAYLPIRAGQDPPVLWGMTGSARSFLRHVSGQPYSSRLFDAPLGAVLQKLALFARALPGELPWLAIALSGAGLWALWRRSRVLLAVLTTEAVLVLAHAMSYRIRDIESYYIPVYAVLALAAGVGLFAVADVLGRARGRIAAAAPIVALVIALVLPLVPLTTGWRARDLSDRRDVSTYLDRMLSEIAPNGIVVALEDNIVFPLWYARFVEGRRTDVAVVDFVSRAPHLEKWFPGIRFPTEQELAEALAESTGAGGSASTVAETRVVEYLPLFVSLNAGPRPIYLDPAVAAKRLPSRSVPRGLLAQVVEDSTRARAAAREGGLLWETYLGTTAVGEERSPETARSYGRALADQGGLWLARGKPEEALALLEAAVKLAPNVAHIRNNLGAAYERSGRPADALSEYRRALELDAGAPVTYRNIYVVLRNRGDLEEAREFLVIASRLDPGNVDDLLELAALSEQLGEPDEARPIYEEAERLAPDSWEVQAAFGDYLTRIERYPAALAYFERAAARSPRSARVQRGLARCHWALGAPDLAIEAMRRSVELAPSDASATYDLAVMLVRTESPDEALAHLDRALSLEPRLWPARALKAGILTDAGRHEEARRAFERARRDGAGGRAFWTAWLNLERSAGDSVAARALLDSLARAGAAPRKGHAGTPAPRQDGP